MPPTLEELLDQLDEDVRQVGKKTDDLKKHGPSRFVGKGADPETARHVAAGGGVDPATGYPVRTPSKGGADWVVKGRSGNGYRTVNPGEYAREGQVIPGVTKALAEATSSAGGYVIPTQLSDQLADLVRARTVTRALGATVVPNVLKQEDIPALTGPATASWTSENANIPTSQQTFGLAGSLVPHPLAALVPLSRKLLLDAAVGATNLKIDEIVSNDISAVVAIAEDTAFLNGSGTGQPKGVMQTSGTTPGPNLGTNGGTPTFDNLIDIVAALQGISADLQNAGWAFHPRTLQTLMKIKDSQGRYLWEEQNLMTLDKSASSGTLLSFPWRTTTSIPVNQTKGTSNNASTILFGDWSEVFIGESVVPMTVDTSEEASYTPDGTTWVNTFQAQQVLFRLVHWLDSLVRRPQLFVVTTGVLP